MFHVLHEKQGVVFEHESFTLCMKWLIAKASEYTTSSWFEGEGKTIIYLRCGNEFYKIVKE